jgi:hypothetical protein
MAENRIVINSGQKQKSNIFSDRMSSVTSPNEIRLFDDFMIIGADAITVGETVVEPATLYSFTHKLADVEKCPRRKVVKNFCFPDDIKLKEVTSMDEVEEIKSQNGTPYIFLFTLNNEE